MEQLLITLISSGSGFYTSFLDYSSLIVILAGIVVIIVKNPIVSLIALIAVYGFVSIFLMFTGLTFIAFSYIIVYIGAVSILFLFILMLIDIRTSELQINNTNSVSLASLLVIFLNFTLAGELPQIINSFDSLKEIIRFDAFFDKDVISNTTLNNINEHIEIMYATSSNWDGNITETSHISSIGNILYTSYSTWLFITSLILLLVMVGAIVITIK